MLKFEHLVNLLQAPILFYTMYTHDGLILIIYFV